MNQQGKELLTGLKRSEWIPPYDSDAIRSIIQESNQLMNEFDTLTSQSINEDGNHTLPPEQQPKAAYYLSCLKRNHLYLYCYNRYRLDKIRNLRWEVGPVLPETIKNDLSEKENDYFTEYNKSVDKYNEEFGFDITADLEPPKDLFVEIKVLESCGRIMTDHGPVNLEQKGSVLYVRRSQVETFLREGKVTQIVPDTEC